MSVLLTDNAGVEWTMSCLDLGSDDTSRSFHWSVGLSICLIALPSSTPPDLPTWPLVLASVSGSPPVALAAVVLLQAAPGGQRSFYGMSPKNLGV